MASKKWTSEEVEYLKLNYGRQSAQELADKFQVSKQAIISKCYKLGISAKENRGETWSEEENKIMHEHFENAPLNLIKELLPNRTMHAINQHGNKELGLSRISKDRYKLDYKFFEIWTPESAYIYGLISADGYIKYEHGDRNENSLQFELADYDADILYKIKDILQYEGDVRYSKRNTVKFSIGNKKLIKDLIDKGIPKINKTFEIKYPETLPDELFSHYLRGLFDGDGTIYEDHDILLFRLLGSESLLNSIHEKICKLCLDISTNHIQDRNKYGTNVFALSVKNKDSIKIFDFMYKDSTIHLDRKYNKYLEYKNK
jgi:hypothetical protein